ncbi:hypothetical protein B2J93_6404 [Marssonina coronariae]|uniref:Uncharacterized protein n=1 Tax=Diplocarpon coronariae TaxID=2795749 RepID=A0A218Z4W9_9HELO|nr:hypothetical protein B2J93_6404 [Marssonina coronariae]
MARCVSSRCATDHPGPRPAATTHQLLAELRCSLSGNITLPSPRASSGPGARARGGGPAARRCYDRCAAIQGPPAWRVEGGGWRWSVALESASASLLSRPRGCPREPVVSWRGPAVAGRTLVARHSVGVRRLASRRPEWFSEAGGSRLVGSDSRAGDVIFPST